MPRLASTPTLTSHSRRIRHARRRSGPHPPRQILWRGVFFAEVPWVVTGAGFVTAGAGAAEGRGAATEHCGRRHTGAALPPLVPRVLPLDRAHAHAPGQDGELLLHVSRGACARLP